MVLNKKNLPETLPGYLITLEGIDGSGKSSLIKRLANYLETTHSVVVTKEPGGSQLGKELRSILQTQTSPVTALAEFLLFAADRAQHFEQIIIPALRQGSLVLSDRCADSSIAYQGFGRGVDCHMIDQVNQCAMQGVRPDFTLYLEIDAEMALRRLQKRATVPTVFEKTPHAFWVNVIKGYEQLFAKNNNVARIDARLTEEEVFEQARGALVEYLGNHPKL